MVSLTRPTLLVLSQPVWYQMVLIHSMNCTLNEVDFYTVYFGSFSQTVSVSIWKTGTETWIHVCSEFLTVWDFLSLCAFRCVSLLMMSIDVQRAVWLLLVCVQTIQCCSLPCFCTNLPSRLTREDSSAMTTASSSPIRAARCPPPCSQSWASLCPWSQ